MLPSILAGLTALCLGWFLYELHVAVTLRSGGTRVRGVVARREWISTGRTRNVRAWVSFPTNSGPLELPVGYLSWWGFRHLQPGEAVEVLHHPRFRFVVPAGLGGVVARPIIAGSLLAASGIVAAAFLLAESARFSP